MAASSSPVIACARMSCQIGALVEREVHAIGDAFTSSRGSMFPPEGRIGFTAVFVVDFSLLSISDKIPRLCF